MDVSDEGCARLAYFPDGRAAAPLAITENTIVGGANVSFDAVVVNFVSRLADITDQKNNAKFLFPRGWRGKFHFPEILNVVKERDAVSVVPRVRADLADDADFRFFVALWPAKNQLLLGRKLVPGNEAGTVTAEHHSFCGLRKNLAAQVRTDQEDGDFFRDAAASAHEGQGASERPKKGVERVNLEPVGRAGID